MIPQKIAIQLDRQHLLQFMSEWAFCNMPCKLEVMKSKKDNGLIGVVLVITDNPTMGFVERAVRNTGAKYYKLEN